MVVIKLVAISTYSNSPLYTHWTLTQFQWQVMDPGLVSMTSLGPPTPISMTRLGPPTLISMTSLGPPTLVSVTIGTRIFMEKVKKRVKLTFFKIFTMFIVILRWFYVIYVKTSWQCRVPLISNFFPEKMCQVFLVKCFEKLCLLRWGKIAFNFIPFLRHNPFPKLPNVWLR